MNVATVAFSIATGCGKCGVAYIDGVIIAIREIFSQIHWNTAASSTNIKNRKSVVPYPIIRLKP